MVRDSIRCGRTYVLYSYDYTHGNTRVRVDEFWKSQRQVRSIIRSQRQSLLRIGKTGGLPDMRILKFKTIPVDQSVIIRILNEQNEGLSFLFQSQAVVEVVSTP